jgi:hypothetical protein
MENTEGLPRVTYRIQHEVTRKRMVVHHNRVRPHEAPKIPSPLHPDMMEPEALPPPRPNLFQKQLSLVPVAPRGGGGYVAPAIPVVPGGAGGYVAPAVPVVPVPIVPATAPAVPPPDQRILPTRVNEPRMAQPENAPEQANAPLPRDPPMPVVTRSGRVIRKPTRFDGFVERLGLLPPLQPFEFKESEI